MSHQQPLRRSGLRKRLLHNQPLKRFRRNLIFYLGLPFLRLVSRLPLPMARAMGLALGTAVFHLSRMERRVALENLTHAFGSSKTAKEIRNLCRRVFHHN